MKRVYESTVVFDGVLPEDTLRKEIDKVSEILGGEGAVQKVDEWGRRDLAYTIRKRKSGYYVMFVHEGEGDVPAKLSRAMRLNDNVLRHLSVVTDPRVEALQAQRKAEIAARVAAAEAAGGESGESDRRDRDRDSDRRDSDRRRDD